MRYVPALDGIRALAVLAVVAFHARVPGFNGGFLGVDVFFVLSGYLITRILRDEHDRTGGISIWRFYLRRARRLYPALLTFLAVFAVTAPFVFSHIPTAQHLRDVAVSALYVADYAKQLGMPMNVIGHTWSLAIEEQFYLLWPLCLLAILRLREGRALWGLAAAFALATVWRWWNVESLANPWDVYRRFDTHATGLILGCLAGYARTSLRPAWGVAGAVGLAVTLYVFPWGTPESSTFGHTAAELSTALLVLSRPVWLGGSILPWLGRMSYGLYLWHYPIVRYYRDAFADWPFLLLVSLGGGLAFAALSYYTIEAWFRSLPVKDKLDVIDVPVEVRTRAASGVVE